MSTLKMFEDLVFNTNLENIGFKFDQEIIFYYWSHSLDVKLILSQIRIKLWNYDYNVYKHELYYGNLFVWRLKAAEEQNILVKGVTNIPCVNM